MDIRVIYRNDYFTLMSEDEKVYILVNRDGYDISKFNTEVLVSVPRLKITKFTALSTAIQNALDKQIEVGMLSELVEISVNPDGLIAYAELKMTPTEFEKIDGDVIRKYINRELLKSNISFGIIEIDKARMSIAEKFIVAKGMTPIQGKDAQIAMYELLESKPQIVAAGGVDHYELSVINKIIEGEWLGERIEPTLGIPGRSVFGTEIKAVDGHQVHLKFDSNSVRKEYNEKEGKSFLYARRSGAAVYIGEAISVQNSLEVTGAVGFGTGNIDFNGSVDIMGTVEDNFSVCADENIQISGDMGIGAVELIESRDGDVYIKGGIAGRHKAVIKAKGNVFTKFASDCKIISGGTVNIGFYAMNCDIEAKEVIFEAPSSRLIGGKASIDIQLRVGELGSKSSTKTYVTISGFQREKLQEEYLAFQTSIETTKEKMEEQKHKYEEVKMKEKTIENEVKMEAAYSKMLKYKEQLNRLYESRQRYISYLHARGDGEVKITQKVYPNVFITIKDKGITIFEESKFGKSYYYSEGNIVEE